ncbi:hypothetical protein, partial [Pricia sp.]|uniref:hypothetical protein n=1 Tax=Pricia sp. TaxID=2268138 RepID=UPI003593023D
PYREGEGLALFLALMPGTCLLLGSSGLYRPLRPSAFLLSSLPISALDRPCSFKIGISCLSPSIK